jgi:hypothetical protein
MCRGVAGDDEYDRVAVPSRDIELDKLLPGLKAILETGGVAADGWKAEGELGAAGLAAALRRPSPLTSSSMQYWPTLSQLSLIRAQQRMDAS